MCFRFCDGAAAAKFVNNIANAWSPIHRALFSRVGDAQKEMAMD